MVLALKSGDLKSFSREFKKIHVLNFSDVCKESKFSEMQILIDSMFPYRLNSGSYGIYALTEELARGVDFPTTY